jgi:hypothetical protein
MDKDNKEIIDAAIEQLKAELQRRTDERIANGDVVMLPPVIVGLPEAVEDEKARKIAQLRAKGEKRAVAWGHAAEGQELSPRLLLACREQEGTTIPKPSHV